MNASDRKIILRLQNCMAIPKPFGGGTRSATYESHIGYSKDMDFASEKVRSVLAALRIGEAYEGQIDGDLQELEEWYARRKSENWRTP